MSDPKRLSRRKFIGRSIAGIAGAGVLASGSNLAFAQEDAAEKKDNEDIIIRRKLGRTGPVLPIVSMGVMNASIPNIVALSYEKGIRHFDSASAYMNGENEKMVGQVINKLKVRDEVIISTKNLTPRHREGLKPEQYGEKLIKTTNESLKRLNMDYVDILYYHSVTTAEDASVPSVKEAFDTLKKEGKIRFSGIASHQGQSKVLTAAVENGFYDVALVAINIALAGFPEYMDAIKKAHESGIGLVAMKTQAGGQWWKYVFDEELKEPNQTAMLKWVLRNEAFATAIPGHTEPAQLDQNWSVVHSLEYTPAEEEFLGTNELLLGFDFCRQCRGCLASCPNDVDIPTLMRTHMYAAQYRNFHQARYTYDEIPKAKGLSACSDCRSCTAKCAHTVDIAGRIDELKLMYA